jgi:hypothetical protein
VCEDGNKEGGRGGIPPHPPLIGAGGGGWWWGVIGLDLARGRRHTVEHMKNINVKFKMMQHNTHMNSAICRCVEFLTLPGPLPTGSSVSCKRFETEAAQGTRMHRVLCGGRTHFTSNMSHCVCTVDSVTDKMKKRNNTTYCVRRVIDRTHPTTRCCLQPPGV